MSLLTVSRIRHLASLWTALSLVSCHSGAPSAPTSGDAPSGQPLPAMAQPMSLVPDQTAYLSELLES